MSDLAPPDPASRVQTRSDIVRSAARAWTGQIIDLGGRNTLLFYKDLKAGTIDLSPAENIDASVVRSLIDGRPCRLSTITDTENLAALARRARTVKAKATENYEERGLQTLFLAVGMATWVHTRSDAVPAAPVVLAPVRLAPRGGAAEDFELQVDGDWEVNPTLLHLLKTDFDIDLDAEDLLADESPDGAIAQLTARCTDVPGFGVERRVVIGNFSYAKQPMALDIEGSVEAMMTHPVVAAIAGADDARAELTNAQPVVELSLPDSIPPADEFLILDADASQSYVINAAVRGANLVVQGPPGTGKSQTIANLIATLSARGLSTLFVAEKRAAIDAVTNRLAQCDLDSLVMDLHGGSGSRKAVLAEVGRALDRVGSIPAVDHSAEDERLEKARHRLSAYSAELHRLQDADRLSIFDMQSLLLAIPEERRTKITLPRDVLDNVPWPSVVTVEDLVVEWVELGGQQLDDQLHPWSAAAGRITTAHDATAALDLAQQLATSTIPSASDLLSSGAAEVGLGQPSTIAEWEVAISLLTQVEQTLDKYDAAIYNTDLDSLVVDLQPAHKGAAGRAAATLFNSSYRRAKKLAAAASKQDRAAVEHAAALADARDQAQRWREVAVDGGQPRLPASLDESRQAMSTLTTQLAALSAYVGTVSTSVRLDEAERHAGALVDDRTMLFRMPRLHEIEARLNTEGFRQVLADVRSGRLNPTDARSVVRSAWLQSRLDVCTIATPVLANFDGTAQSVAVSDFQQNDSNHVHSGPTKILRHAAMKAVDTLNEHPEQAQLIRQQAGRKRGHLPLRSLLQQAPEVLLAVKPCWAMSPLIVSQLLPSDPPLFDYVIFDEASQIPPAEAIPAILRGRQVIVAGDSRQLPPTTFFASATEQEEVDDAVRLTSDMESILDAMVALLPPPHGSKSLRWHYRSRDERLIAFSNAQPALYDWTMTTFPGVGIDHAIRHVGVPWRPHVHGEENSSGDEVRKVVELIATHARERPEESLGVITMGIKHCDRIAEAVRLERRGDADLDAFCSSHEDEPFFVKNLERVQGDERDAIIISIGYGKSAEGRMIYRFGPLLQEGGERRLNVAITRAKRSLTLVSSFGAEDLDDARLNSEGMRMLKRYLTYAASEGRDLGSVAKERPALNPFETDVMRCLTAAGIPLTPQVGASGYWIDFAATHPEFPGRFVLAIEADGASYHSSATARDRDRLRQEHLERLGWSFHRIWSTAWFRDRNHEIERAVAAWIAAVARSDSADGPAPTAPQPARPAQNASGVRRSGAKPAIYPGEPITTYETGELDALIRWIRSDTLLRTDDELIDLAIRELGFQRRGNRIVSSLQAAIDRTRSERKLSQPPAPAASTTRPAAPAATTQSAGTRPPAPGASSRAATTPPGWYGDPSGKFQYRYWDGSTWTANVSRDGVTYTD